MIKKRTQKGFAKKEFGQNFLQNSWVRDQIIKSAPDLNGQNILEIGPGLGFLTSALLKARAEVTAVEIDPRAAEILKREFPTKDNLTLVEADILKIDIDKLFQAPSPTPSTQPPTPYAVIANIPYNITSFLLRRLLSETKNKPQYCILMVQKEVAEKIACERAPLTEPEVLTNEKMSSIEYSFNPNVVPQKKSSKEKKRTMLSISVEIYATSEIICTVPASCFSPAPKVDSAVIKISLRDKPLIDHEMEADFFTVVQAGFSERRKKLGNHIGTFFGLPSQKLLGDISPETRAEDLSIEEWIEITHNFRKTKA